MVKRIAFATHVALVDGKEYDGIGNVIKKTLDDLTDQYVFVRHSIDGRLVSEAQYYEHTKVRQTRKLHVLKHPAPMRYIAEIFQSVRYFSAQKNQVDIYVGVDPLNAFAGILLKRFRKVQRAIFYTADYSLKRFGNPVLNYLYHSLDKYCVRHADEVWSVSTRICDVRRSMGLPDEKNKFIPNVPPSSFAKLSEAAHDKFELITTGIIDTQLDFEGAIRAVADLSHIVPKLHLTIVGNGPEEARLKELVSSLGIKHRVKFTGRLPLEDTLKLQSTAGIGLALYTGVWGFNQFGDSTKCREYFSFGLPVISTDTHSTVEDIKSWHAGVIVEKDVDAYKKAIVDILDRYDDFSRNSRKAGLKYRGIHSKLFSRLLQ